MNLNIDREIRKFYEYLQRDNNERIIFSGVFGIGKTYFLKRFFEKYEKEYSAVFISPVNYSIASNEDIFDYIKYDMIIEALSMGAKLEMNHIPETLMVQFYISNNILNLFSSIIDFTSKLGIEGKVAQKVFNTLKASYNDFNDYKKSIQKKPANTIQDTFDEVMSKKTHAFAKDANMELVEWLITELKNDDKKVILIIDDLDRIDPDHIFRILNIFACHLDTHPERNKFQLDQLLLVCDIENIRNIFHSRFGINSDFNGYIDKFYSQDIFTFNNSNTIKDNLPKILHSINVYNEYDDQMMIR